jgi:hypothetical protein
MSKPEGRIIKGGQFPDRISGVQPQVEPDDEEDKEDED